MVKGDAAGRHLDRHDLGLVASLRCGLAEILAIVIGRVEAADRRRHLPAMRAARILDRAAGGTGVVERHPAGAETRRHHPVAVAVVLVEAQRLRPRRLPDHIVLGDARAVPAHQLGTGPAHGLGQDDPGDGPVRAPAVADLTGEVGRVAPLAPVPLVGVEAGLELAAEQGLEPGTGGLDQFRGRGTGRGSGSRPRGSGRSGPASPSDWRTGYFQGIARALG